MQEPTFTVVQMKQREVVEILFAVAVQKLHVRLMFKEKIEMPLPFLIALSVQI